ncbi:hypothetical protein QTP88_008451 [Uroleucon formosanum]
MRACKRTALFLENQKNVYPGKRPLRMKTFSTTRWTSHHRSLFVIFEKFKAIIATFENFSESIDRLCSSTANNLLKNVTSFCFVTVMFLMNKIFDITTPLSIYLQTPSNDYIQALTMVDIAEQRLSKLRTQEKDSIGMEYRNFALSFKKLQSGKCPEKLHDDVLISENTSDEDDSTINSEMDDEDILHNRFKKIVFPTQIFELLNSFKLASAFSNLYMAYKSLCIIPVTSVSSECSFSKVKLIKTRLCSTIGQSRLEGLLLLSCEKDVSDKINIQEVIDTLANNSTMNWHYCPVFSAAVAGRVEPSLYCVKNPSSHFSRIRGNRNVPLR